MSRLKSDTEHLYITTIGDGYDCFLQSNNTTILRTSNAGINVTGHVTLSGNVSTVGLNGTGPIYTSGNIGKDGGDYFTFTTDTKLDLYLNGSNEFMFGANGDFHADGDLVAFSTTISSDERIKHNIRIVDDALEKTSQLRGVQFDWNKDNTPSAGVIAQDVAKVLPEAVKSVKGLNDEQEFLTVNYDALTSLLIESIKELKGRIEELENKVG